MLAFLAHHPQHLATLAAWHVAEWGLLYPNWQQPEALSELSSHTASGIPSTLIWLEPAGLAGSVSLIKADLEGFEHLSPWLASLYVEPSFRGRGLGKTLMQAAVTQAKAWGIRRLYLFTQHQEELYSRWGWHTLQYHRHQGKPLAIMTLEL